MNTDMIIDKLMEISHQPFLIFATQVEEKSDNAFETLCLLNQEEKVTAGRISEFLDIKPSSVTQIIKKLEALGMVQRVKSDEDARVIFVKLTEAGRQSVTERGSVATDLKSELFKDFTEADLIQLNQYLSQITDNVSSEEFQQKLNTIFADDRRWQHFSQMSSHFSRAREQMLERSHFNRMDSFSHHCPTDLNSHHRFSRKDHE